MVRPDWKLRSDERVVYGAHERPLPHARVQHPLMSWISRPWTCRSSRLLISACARGASGAGRPRGLPRQAAVRGRREKVGAGVVRILPHLEVLGSTFWSTQASRFTVLWPDVLLPAAPRKPLNISAISPVVEESRRSTPEGSGRGVHAALEEKKRRKMMFKKVILCPNSTATMS